MFDLLIIAVLYNSGLSIYKDGFDSISCFDQFLCHIPCNFNGFSNSSSLSDQALNIIRSSQIISFGKFFNMQAYYFFYYFFLKDNQNNSLGQNDFLPCSINYK